MKQSNMLRACAMFFALLTQFLAVAQSADHLLRLNYSGYSLLLNCETRSAVWFEYWSDADNGDLDRRSSFSKDPSIAESCQQTSSESYKTSNDSASYDRGHLVPANHLDHDKLGIYQSNYMTNILPQVRQMNRGAWLRTEEIVECYRDVSPLRVQGGPIYGDNDNDLFFQSHGITTPTAYWKVITMEDGPVIAWIIPNNKEAIRKNLDSYLVSLTEIEIHTNFRFPQFIQTVREEKAESSWPLPNGCDKS